jgi:hypothetical protein
MSRPFSVAGVIGTQNRMHFWEVVFVLLSLIFMQVTLCGALDEKLTRLLQNPKVLLPYLHDTPI